MDIGHIRHDFADHQPLDMAQLDGDPIAQFAAWFDEALCAGMPEPNAFVLATATAGGQPSQRSVLLKYFDRDGFVFYTNYQSRKAVQIAQNHAVAMLFPWFGLQRQVKIEGFAEKVSRAQSLRYFLSRPRDSRLGAWASPQSQVIDSRKLLIEQWRKMQEKFAEGEVPLPDFWGGYRIRPISIEFWQGQPSRLHDRFVYSRSTLEEKNWAVKRLAP